MGDHLLFLSRSLQKIIPAILRSHLVVNFVRIDFLNTFQYEHNTKYEISMKVCPTTYVCTSQKQHKQKKLVIVTEISFAILKKL